MSGNLFVNGVRYGMVPVCHFDWDIKDAAVVCRMLVNVSALAATTDSEFGRVVDDWSMSSFECSGEEEAIRYCRKARWQSSGYCADKAAGVVCGGNECRYHDYYNYTIQYIGAD